MNFSGISEAFLQHSTGMKQGQQLLALSSESHEQQFCEQDRYRGFGFINQNYTKIFVPYCYRQEKSQERHRPSINVIEKSTKNPISNMGGWGAHRGGLYVLMEAGASTASDCPWQREHRNSAEFQVLLTKTFRVRQWQNTEICLERRYGYS